MNQNFHNYIRIFPNFTENLVAIKSYSGADLQGYSTSTQFPRFRIAENIKRRDSNQSSIDCNEAKIDHSLRLPSIRQPSSSQIASQIAAFLLVDLTSLVADEALHRLRGFRCFPRGGKLRAN